MILFKRIRESVGSIEGREWVLLCLETFGVLAGILIAFELQEWGSQRDQAAKHRQLMERLFEESRIDVAVLRDLRDSLQTIVKPEETFATSLGKGQCPRQEDFRSVATLTMLPALTAPTSVYQELLGAGGLSSIEREDVREHVAQFHGSLDWAKGQVDYFRMVRITPLEISDPRVKTHFDLAANDPQVDVFDRNALCNDQGFKNRVAAAARQHAVYASYFQGTLEDAISMCVRLGDSLGKTCVPTFGGALNGDDAKYSDKATKQMKQDLAKPN
jgi:hypothetical protein